MFKFVSNTTHFSQPASERYLAYIFPMAPILMRPMVSGLGITGGGRRHLWVDQGKDQKSRALVIL